MDGLEECQPTQHDDATVAPRRRLGLATIVPFDAGQQTNRAPTRVPTACGLLLAWQLTTHRPAELLAGHRRRFCQGGRREEGDGGGVSNKWCGEGARQRACLPDCVSFLVWHRKTMFSKAVRNTAAISE